MVRRCGTKFKSSRRQTPRRAKDMDVPHCEFHTFVDERTGKEGRTGPCNGHCRFIDATKGGFPLSNFLVKLLGYGDDDLAKADAKKAARLYGINQEHAAGYIRLEQQRRGLSHAAN